MIIAWVAMVPITSDFVDTGHWLIATLLMLFWIVVTFLVID